MPEDKKFCVYRHTSPSGKVYIGVTSQNILARWRNGKGYPQNRHFTSAIEKYGWDNFRHEILFSDLPKDEAFAKEIELIQFHRSNNPDYGYNQSSGGEYATTGWHPSEETRKKQRTAKLGKKLSEEHRRRIKEGAHSFTHTAEARRKIGEAKRKQLTVQMNLDGDIVGVHLSTKIAAEAVGCCQSMIIMACEGRRKTAKGYKWKYEPIHKEE
jgi:group I intron endonuclease